MVKVLAVEDDEIQLKNIQKILKLQGYKVFAAANGKDGLELSREYNPDVIVCDVNMPVMDGFELLKEIRRDPKSFMTPFLFLTANIREESRRLGMDLGADDYLTKPYDADQLANAVEARISKHERMKKAMKKEIEDLRASVASSLPHELNTPLNSIIGFAQYMNANYDGLEPKEIKSMSETLLDAGRRLYSIISAYNYYISLLGMDSKTVKNMARKVDASYFIYESAISYALKYKRRDDLKIELCHCEVKIKEDHFARFLDELIDNAFKFSNEGEPVEIISKYENGEMRLLVSNSGKPMTEGEIARIGAFIQFNRDKMEQQGLGLGLAIAGKIAEIYGWRIRISSESGKKTSFVVSAPAEKAEADFE